MKCSAIRTPLHFGCMDLQREEVAMCLAWIGFHEDSGSNCAKSLLGASFNFSGDRGLLRGQENVLMGGKEIEGNILEGGELRRRMGVLLVNL